MSARCQQHGSAATHVCVNPSCFRFLCEECRLSHKSMHSSAKDELPLQKALEKCRHRLAEHSKNLEATFSNFENQLTALEAIRAA